MKFKKIIVLFICLILLTGCKKDNTTNNEEKDSTKVEEKKLNIVDINSNSRPYAVMINNLKAARPQAGLSESIINYEIIAEGGITRFLAIFKDKLPEKIGSIRSSRIYYLDYALENDAIYIHWGGSTEAYSDIDSLDIDHIDGITYSTKYFYRDKTLGRSTEHTGFSKGSLLKEGVSDLGFRTTTDKGNLLNYTTDVVDLSSIENAMIANYVSINYSNYQTSNYVYDEENKVYLRYDNDEESVDLDSNEQYSTKNIITYQVKNTSYDSYGRQKLDNIGSGEGYYITNGYAVPITWQKSCRSCKTVYKYMNGEEIKVSDGNTWIQIQPLDKILVISESSTK